MTINVKLEWSFTSLCWSSNNGNQEGKIQENFTNKHLLRIKEEQDGWIQKIKERL